MFKISKELFLETAHGPIGNDIIKAAFNNSDYFSDAIGKIKDVTDSYESNKKELYNNIINSDGDDTLSAVPTGMVKESSDSTSSFIKYFGNSISILNTALGNITNTVDAAINQARIAVKEACDSNGCYAKKEYALSPIKRKERCEEEEWVYGKDELEDAVCPGCGCNPCKCDNPVEKIYKYDTDHYIPNLRDMDYSNKPMEDVIHGDLRDDNKYEDMYGAAAERNREALNRFRAKICGDEYDSCDAPNYGYALHDKFCKGAEKMAIDDKCLEKCKETVETYVDRLQKVKENAKDIIESYQAPIDNINKIIKLSEDGKTEDENMVPIRLNDDNIQRCDLYCKAEIDKLVTMCNMHMLSIAAKLSAMQDEFNQCKALLDKYVNGIYTVDNLPKETPVCQDPEPQVGNSDSVVHDDTAKTESAINRLEKYVLFMEDLAFEEAQFNAFLNESMGIDIMNEGVVSSVKNAVERVMQFLQKLWGNFTNGMDKVFKNDQQYLSDNKNIILGNTVKSASITNWYQYNMDLITKAAVPEFPEMESVKSMAMSLNTNNVTISDKIKTNQNTDQVIQNYFREYVDNSITGGFGEMVKAKLRGKNPVNVDAKSFNGALMQQMYDFCYNYGTNMKPTLENDIKTINELSQNATQALAELEKKEESAEPKDENNNTKKSDYEINYPPKDNNGAKKESYSYADMYSNYFNEGEATVKISNVNKTASADTGVKNDYSAANTNIKQASDGDKAAANTNAANANSPDNKDNTKVSDEQRKLLTNYVKSVFDVNKAFLDAKLKTIYACYSSYMKIIRWHVGQYTGTQSANTSDTVRNNQQGTDGQVSGTTIKI